MTATRALFAPALLALLLCAAPAKADAVADLTALVKNASTNANPTMAFMNGLAAMPNFQLKTADIRRALAAANLPPGGILDKILSPCTRLTKNGERVEIDRTERTRVALDTGAGVELGEEIRARFRVLGPHDAAIDGIDGIKVAEEAGGSYYGLKDVRFTREDGKPVAKITAGAWGIYKTKTVDMTPKKPVTPTPTNTGPVASNTTPPAPVNPTPGLVALGQSSHTVATGDTLYNIAKRHGVSVAALKEANNLTSDSVSLGTTLRIPPRP
jgi:LysM repeat protein